MGKGNRNRQKRMNTQPPVLNLKVDLGAIPDMKCYCGNSQFLMVYKLKFVSPVHCGDPRGASAVVGHYRCVKCGQLYSEALSQDRVGKLKKHVDAELTLRNSENEITVKKSSSLGPTESQVEDQTKSELCRGCGAGAGERHLETCEFYGRGI